MQKVYTNRKESLFSTKITSFRKESPKMCI